jgi:phosphoribosylaminoimidazolecarboxamide formyltransferase/IMP cyclohydrolase
MTSLTRKIALVSVTDKTGLVELAQGLIDLSFVIVSTGGTAKILRESNLPVLEVSDLTEFPEILDGRVKTLHPTIHGGILADRNNPQHAGELRELNIQTIDIVVVNLYNFASAAVAQQLPLEKAIEYIDVGGPTMLRAAAKNHRHCLPVVDPSDYGDVIRALRDTPDDMSFRQKMAAKVFTITSQYDQMIADYFASISHIKSFEASWPRTLDVKLELAQSLRYGENAHQTASLYRPWKQPAEGLAAATPLQGKELSYNNYVDLDAAAAIVSDLFPLPSITIIKHTNPCGTASSSTLDAQKLFELALKCDPKCAFGGVVAANICIDEPAARVMAEVFLECIIALDFTPGALKVFSEKKNLRLIRSSIVCKQPQSQMKQKTWKSITGGFLIQDADTCVTEPSTWECVTRAKPDASMLSELSFSMTVCKHVKSNAIVLSSGRKTIGIGAGQMSRVDSARFAIEKARELAHEVPGSVLASDAFFPFRDTVDLAAKAGVRGIIQPGGSLKDQESIAAANEHGIVMMFSGRRHFKH